jgi:8-oxo-dGTP pyrophosphatase MutT (NUDIX family)
MREDTELENNCIAEKLSKTLKTTDCLDVGAAVVVLLRAVDKDFQILFVKRAEKSTDPWSGQTAFPGGKRDPEDRDLKETVVRETLEETGMNLREGCRFLGEMEPLRSTQRPEMKILPFVVLQEQEHDIKLNEELSEYFWVSLKELVQREGSFKCSYQEHPAYVIKNNIIWGLTYRILQKLLLLLSAADCENPELD